MADSEYPRAILDTFLAANERLSAAKFGYVAV